MKRGSRQRWRLAIVVGLVALPLAALAATDKKAAVKSTVELPEPLTREAIRELIARLSDEDVRNLLMAQLDKAAAPAASKADGSPATDLAGEVDRIRTRMGAVLGAAPGLPSELGDAVRRYSQGGRSGQLPLVCAFFALLLAIAAGVERLVGGWLRGVRRRLEADDHASVAAQAGGLLVRLALDVVQLGVFVATMLGLFFVLYQGHEPSRALFMAALVATIEIRLATIVARLLFAPRLPAQRLVPVDDAMARELYRGVWILAVIFGVTEVVVGFVRRWGVSPDAVLLLSTVVRLVFAGIFLRLVWRCRAPFTAAIRGDGSSPLRRTFADFLPVLMTAYVLILLVALTVEQLAGRALHGRTGILSLLVVLLLPLIDRGICRLFLDGAHSGDAVKDQEGAGSPGYVPVLRKGVHIVVTVGGLLFLARRWDVDLLVLAERGVGARFAGALIDVAVTLLLAYLAWQLIRTAIDLRLAREAGPKGVSDPGEAGGTGTSRLATLLPLARGFIFITICVMAAMTVLASLGVNIGPLLAGAGVIGLAVGFGAQTLVRDIISGAFYLLDDAFRLGEYIDVGEAKGTVEKIGIRSMQLRHHRGALNVVPYGGIRRMNNQSRDWVVEKLEFRVAYDTDIIKVKKIIRKIGEELMAHPEIGPQLLQPLKSQGVLAMEGSGMLVKAKFMAKPGEQFVIRREAYQRLKKAFDEAGIHFAQTQVTVFAPPGSDSAAAAAAGAAAAAAAEPPAGSAG